MATGCFGFVTKIFDLPLGLLVSMKIYVDEKITFIKMDIEGAEQKALHGAGKIIKKYRPKLAISVYHLPNDIIEIPLMIHNMVSEYQLFLRHHYSNHWETVLYAKIV